MRGMRLELTTCYLGFNGAASGAKLFECDLYFGSVVEDSFGLS